MLFATDIQKFRSPFATDPILKIDYYRESTSVIAPSVLIENNKVRMWYMGVIASGTRADFAIGYAESDFPFNW